MEKPDARKDGGARDENDEKNYPRVTQHDMNRTLVLYVPQHGKYIGLLRIIFDDEGNVIEESGQPVLLDSSVPQDEETLVFLKNASLILEEVAEDYRIPDRDEVLATATATLDGKAHSCRMNECSLGNFVAEAVLYMFDKYGEEPNSRHIDAVVVNSGMIHHSIQAGEVTVRDLTHALFLGDLFECARMNGSELREMVEHSVDEYDITGISASGAFLQFSGLRVVYDLNQPIKHRVKSIMIRSGNSYTRVMSSRYYSIAMPSFLRKGNDGFKSHLNAFNTTYGEDDISLLIAYLKEIKIIKPKIDKRISFYDEDISTSSLKKPEYSDSKNGTNISSVYNVSKGDNSQAIIKESRPPVVTLSSSENFIPGNKFKLSTVFEVINSSLSDLERSFLESVISESGKEQSIPSIDALEEHLNFKVKHFLKVEKISTGSPDDIFPSYQDKNSIKNESFDETTNNSVETGDSLPHSVTELSTKSKAILENTAVKPNQVPIKTDVKYEATIEKPNGKPSKTDMIPEDTAKMPNGEASKTDIKQEDTAEKHNSEPSKIPLLLTESDQKDAQSIHEFLVYSIVQSIVDKIKEHLLLSGKKYEKPLFNKTLLVEGKN